ncbi:hypothetical protein AMECASPLE_033829, partial [Ameca splendens]
MPLSRKVSQDGLRGDPWILCHLSHHQLCQCREKYTLEQDIRDMEEAIRQKSGEVQEMQNDMDRETTSLQELEAQKQDAQDRLEEMEQQKHKLEDMLNEVHLKCQEESQL